MRPPTLMRISYKANPASLPTTVVDKDTGQEKTRLINRMRWKGLASKSITYDDPTVSEYDRILVI
jgi:general transcription factor 3C polypeptide 5 (transcription factor C subunit 1)